MLRLKAGFDVGFECPQPTPMLLVLKIHPSRRRDLLSDQTLDFDPPLKVKHYVDSFDNSCTRIVAPKGRTRISTAFEIRDSGLPDPVVADAVQHEITELPDDVLIYLLGSRYCDTDRLADEAGRLFNDTPPGWPRVQAICDFVHSHLTFDYMQADAQRTASDGYRDGVGVCRDFAHLAITFCRCMNIPARYCTGYLGDIGVPAANEPMDFSAWFQVYLGRRWHTFDARHNRPRIGRILMATGRDATDVALATTFGPARLAHFEVTAEEAQPA